MNDLKHPHECNLCQHLIPYTRACHDRHMSYFQQVKDGALRTGHDMANWKWMWAAAHALAEAERRIADKRTPVDLEREAIRRGASIMSYFVAVAIAFLGLLVVIMFTNPL